MNMWAIDNIKKIHIYLLVILLVSGACASKKTYEQTELEDKKTSEEYEPPPIDLEDKEMAGGEESADVDEIPDEYSHTETRPSQPSTTTPAPGPPERTERPGTTERPNGGRESIGREDDTERPGRTENGMLDNKNKLADSSAVHKDVEGSLAHHIPKEMTMGEISHVELVLSRAKSTQRAIAKLNPQIQDDATTATVEKLSYYMKAELIDYNAVGEDRFFEINLTGGPNHKIQYIDLEDTTSTAKWDWAVKPVKTGTHPLQIKVSMNLDGKIGPTNEPVFQTVVVYSDTVLVTSNRSLSAIPAVNTDTQKSGTSWNTPLAVVGALLVLGFPIFFIYRKRKRKKIFDVQENDDHADPEEIMMLIRNGEVEKAVGELLDLSKINGNEEIKNSIILQQTRWSHLEDDMNKGIISREDQQLERNKIHVALLHILDEMAEQ